MEHLNDSTSEGRVEEPSTPGTSAGAEASTGSDDSGLAVGEWQIWHTYSTYFVGTLPSSPEAAKRLVLSGLCAAAVTRDGLAYWTRGEEVCSGRVNVDYDRGRSGARISLSTETGEDPGDLARSLLFRCARIRFAELHVLGEEGTLPHDYTRAVVWPCMLGDPAGDHISFIPILTVYQTGVAIIELVEANDPAEGTSIPLEHFIDKRVNRYASRFEAVYGPPVLSRFSPAATRLPYQPTGGFLTRLRWLRAELQHARAVRQLTANVGIEGVPGAALVLPHESKVGKETLADLARLLVAVAGYAVSLPRHGVVRRVFAQRKNLLRLGGYWFGKPHVHLFSFPDQEETARDNDSRFRREFGSILGRFIGDAEWVLPPDSRPHDDFNAYILANATLWVWSRSGMRANEPYAVDDMGHLVFNNQVVAVALDYGYIVHRRVFEMALDLPSTDEVIQAREALLLLGRELREASPSGELRDMLADGWQRMDLDALKVDTASALTLSEARSSLLERRRMERFGVLLRFFAAILGAPTLSASVTRPLWEILGWWLPSDPRSASLFLIFLTGVGIYFALRGIAGLAESKVSSARSDE